MKKNLMFILMALFSITLTSCNQKEHEQVKPTLQWNLTAVAEGEGIVEVGFPTGTISIDGIAEVRFVTTNDTINLRSVKLLNYEDVLAEPNNYTKEQVEADNEVNNSVIYVKQLEGDWLVDIKGYAKYGTIYIMIDEHFPEEVELTDEIEIDTIVELK
jgi:hypothetical protein